MNIMEGFGVVMSAIQTGPVAWTSVKRKTPLPANCCTTVGWVTEAMRCGVVADSYRTVSAMKLVLNPWQFDVLVTTNLFGDILSDLVAGLVGGLGMTPGANIGADAAIFEAVHGSAPDIAGKGLANPTALLLAAAMMLDHCKLPKMAERLRTSINQTLNADGVRTGDLGGNATTAQFTAALLERIAHA